MESERWLFEKLLQEYGIAPRYTDLVDGAKPLDDDQDSQGDNDVDATPAKYLHVGRDGLGDMENNNDGPMAKPKDNNKERWILDDSIEITATKKRKSKTKELDLPFEIKQEVDPISEDYSKYEGAHDLNKDPTDHNDDLNDLNDPNDPNDLNDPNNLNLFDDKHGIFPMSEKEIKKEKDNVDDTMNDDVILIGDDTGDDIDDDNNVDTNVDTNNYGDAMYGTGDNVHGQVDTQTNGGDSDSHVMPRTDNSYGENIDNKVEDHLDTAGTDDAFRDAIGDTFGDRISHPVGDIFSDEVGDEVGDTACDSNDDLNDDDDDEGEDTECSMVIVPKFKVLPRTQLPSQARRTINTNKRGIIPTAWQSQLIDSQGRDNMQDREKVRAYQLSRQARRAINTNTGRVIPTAWSPHSIHSEGREVKQDREKLRAYQLSSQARRDIDTYKHGIIPIQSGAQSIHSVGRDIVLDRIEKARKMKANIDMSVMTMRLAKQVVSKKHELKETFNALEENMDLNEEFGTGNIAIVDSLKEESGKDDDVDDNINAEEGELNDERNVLQSKRYQRYKEFEGINETKVQTKEQTKEKTVCITQCYQDKTGAFRIKKIANETNYVESDMEFNETRDAFRVKSKAANVNELDGELKKSKVTNETSVIDGDMVFDEATVEINELTDINEFDGELTANETNDVDSDINDVHSHIIFDETRKMKKEIEEDDVIFVSDIPHTTIQGMYHHTISFSTFFSKRSFLSFEHQFFRYITMMKLYLSVISHILPYKVFSLTLYLSLYFFTKIANILF